MTNEEFKTGVNEAFKKVFEDEGPITSYKDIMGYYFGTMQAMMRAAQIFAAITAAGEEDPDWEEVLNIIIQAIHDLEFIKTLKEHNQGLQKRGH